MKKRKVRKLTTNVDIRRKLIINLIIFGICTIGLAYAYLNTNLSMQGEISVARLKVTCEEGTYLPHASKTCTDCSAGSFCPGNTFSYHPLENQGMISCPVGSISSTKQSSCSVCPNGKTTSDSGSTTCNVDCTNHVGVSTWITPTINGEVITNLCVIESCREGYTKNENSCVANTYQLNLNNENATTSGSENVTVTYENEVPTITPPTKKGYTFEGYYLTIEHDDPEEDEEIKYINSDGTSAKVWDLTTGVELHAKWTVITVTCNAGEYLPADATSCTTCPAGSQCSGGDYNYSETTPQGSTQCPTGTYSSTTGSTSCTACAGGTNSLVGATTCGETCSNADHVKTWSNACNIATCDTGYENNNNVCVARTFNITLNNKNATTPGSTSVTVTYNEPVPSITVPEKFGYTFGGYYTEENGAGTQYIKADGTSSKNWDKTNIDTLYSKWTIITKECASGQYLPANSITCTTCPAGSFCVGGSYNYHSTNNQGITACAIGSYSAAGEFSCTICNGNTTSGVGQTSCNSTCSNEANASTWNEASWNNNEPTGVCSIKTCLTGYHLGSNVCVANELEFANQTIMKDYDAENNQTDNVASASNGTGTYTYAKKSGDADITVSSSGEITIPAGKNAGTYTIVITATDTNSSAKKDATYTITINKLNATLTCSNKTYDGTEQTGCSCAGGTIGGDYKATNAGNYTASCSGDTNHNSPNNETWTMTPKEIAQVTNLEVAPTGIVSWTNSSDATSYQISIDNTNWTNVPAGTSTTTYNFLNSIVGSTGERTIYVKGVSTNTNYSSTTATATTTVYAVTFSVDDTKGEVSSNNLNVIAGSTYTANDNVLTLQDGREVTATPKIVTWGTNSFDSWSNTSGTITGTSIITANFTSEITGYNVTYNANTGTFSDHSTINNVSYNVTKGSVTKYSHTSNIDDTGLKTTYYGNSWTNENITGSDRGDTTKAHVVTIEGATNLIVDLYYNGESTSYDWVSVWAGNYPDYTAANDATSTGYVTTAMGAPNNTNKYGGSQSGSYIVNGNSLTNMGHVTLTILGDTVTFGFKSDGSGYGGDSAGYGYYAIIKEGTKMIAESGNYKEPTKTDYVFTGWNTKANGSGTSILIESDIADLSDPNVTLFAQYRGPSATFTTGQAFNATIKQLSGSSGATYSTTNSNITNFTKYTGTVTETLLNNATIVSSNDSELEIYAWFDNGTIYYYTTSDTIYFNSNCSYMFSYLTNLTTIDLSEFNLSNVTSSTGMFYNMTVLDTIITPKVNPDSYSFSIGKSMMDQSGTTYSSITSSTPTETTLKVPYTITFDLNGGTNSTCSATTNTKKIYPGSQLGTIPTVSANKFGYTQSGMCSDSSCSRGADITATTVPPSSITYYVQWTKTGIWADQISFDDTNLGTSCSDAQCVVKYIADHFKEKRVSINGN